MFRSIKVSIIGLAAVLAVVSGCKSKPKNITPIPGMGAGATTNNTAGVLPPDGGLNGRQPAYVQPPIRPGTGYNPNDAGGNIITSKPIGDGGGAGGIIPAGPRSFGERDTKTLEEKRVFFDYDKSAVRASEKSKVAAVADYMKAHPDQSLVVEGNCDERGTDEYNRALGERRALSIREALIGLGVPADRITTTSFGKDRPLEFGHDEAAWSKNRRGDFVLISSGPAPALQ